MGFARTRLPVAVSGQFAVEEAFMDRGSHYWPWLSRFPLRRRARSISRRRSSRLAVESLEDRRLLTVASAATFDDLAVDQGQSRASSLIVQFKSGLNSAGSLAAYVATAGMSSEWALTPGMRRVDFDPAMDYAAALATFRNDPNVLYAEPDYRVSIQLLPNDPDLSRLWGLDNNGQVGGVEDADIDAPEAWDVERGSLKTVVAVIDTGVDYNHPDLYQN